MPTIDSTSVKRLGIYCFYDPRGEAASYIPVFLDDLTQHLQSLIVIVNGKLSTEARKLFERYTHNIIVRPNKGLDVAAYRQALLTVGWEQLARFDEVLCLNDTVMGPVYPFSEMFSEMDTRDVDFWGITTYEHDESEKEIIPTHLQAYWHAYRRNLIESEAFQKYWEELPPLNDYAEVTHQHEIPFTQHFSELGFKWSSYVDGRKYAELSNYPLLYCPTEIITKDRCPIFKRRSFFVDYGFYFEQTSGSPARRLLDYLKNQTDFDTNLVWDAILPAYNISDIHRALHLNYILPKRAEIVGGGTTTQRVTSAFIQHIYFLDLLSETFRYLSALPSETDLFVTTTEDKIQRIEDFAKTIGFTKEITFIPIENRGRDVAALLVGAKDIILKGKYEVIGFAHDKKSAQNQENGHRGTETQGFTEKLFENTLGSETFVHNVLETFAENPRLGLLTPPPPFHALYFAHTIPLDWGANFENTRLLLKKRLKLKVPIEPGKPSVSAIGSCYWFRRDAMLPIFQAKWTYEDFLPERIMGDDGSVSHAIERANGYVVQSQGYYPAWLLNDEYAQQEVTSLWYSASQLSGLVSPYAEGESLWEIELKAGRKLGGLFGLLRRGKHKVHVTLKKMSAVTVRRFPKPLQEIVYRTFWSPVAVYRSFRRWVGGVVHPPVQINPEVRRLTKVAVTGQKGAGNRRNRSRKTKKN